MINRHAILVTENNLESILRETSASREAMVELLEESLEEGTPYYIVADRLNEDGKLRWGAQTLVEFSVNYNIANVNRFATRWSRV